MKEEEDRERREKRRKARRKNNDLVSRLSSFFASFAIFFFSFTPAFASQQINLNTATVQELESLPGIGPALAKRIIEHREKHGWFKRPQDVIIVRGMSARRYKAIASLIRI